MKFVSLVLLCMVAFSIMYGCSVTSLSYSEDSRILGDPIDTPLPKGDPIDTPLPK